ncbi:hypothetical protein FB45DRAFT_1066368 [Roridomyces roridus]|uniref:Uncharacterized protein n=1 Tax=Roridomyces roridus TaxID=1738132 RepID=A0AAD7B485_9AGAR|nr:hypothetical protein FB45DRAFT_1066368 [Roridomyces roridus]
MQLRTTPPSPPLTNPSLEMKFSSQLIVLFFATIAAAVPASLEGKQVHCDALCRPVDCGDLPVAFYDCFGNPCACVEDSS